MTHAKYVFGKGVRVTVEIDVKPAEVGPTLDHLVKAVQQAIVTAPTVGTLLEQQIVSAESQYEAEADVQIPELPVPPELVEEPDDPASPGGDEDPNAGRGDETPQPTPETPDPPADAPDAPPEGDPSPEPDPGPEAPPEEPEAPSEPRHETDPTG